MIIREGVSETHCVPLVNPVKSRVVPEGTATLDKTMVAQLAFDLLAEAAPLAPENVQEARLSRVAAAVTAGAGAAETRAAPPMAATARKEEKCIAIGPKG